MARPLKFKTPEELEKAVDDYFDKEEQPTLSGLAYHLGVDRKTLYNYKDRDGFFHILKGATDFVESVYEKRLVYSNAPTGVIFALKNMNWRDKTESDITTGGEKINTITRRIVRADE